MSISTADLTSKIQTYTDPYLLQDYVSTGMLKSAELKGASACLVIELPYPAKHSQSLIKESLNTLLCELEGIAATDISITSRIKRHSGQGAEKTPQEKAQTIALPNIKNIIAIASGKGGVGKSTTTANLALALAAEGASVGLLDADIYGPSQTVMMGIPKGTRPDTQEQKYFKPIIAHGVQVMSMGVLMTDDTPAVWRGPMASGALKQMLSQTLWQDLDYLLIDMPPGTGDIQLTLAQSVPVSGSVVVTTPQEIALLDAKKGIEMFNKVNIPVLGIIENMALHTCSECGHSEAIFGEGGGAEIAARYNTRLLGSLPLDSSIREQADLGLPSVLSQPDSAIAAHYRAAACNVAATLSKQAVNKGIPNISMVND